MIVHAKTGSYYYLSRSIRGRHASIFLVNLAFVMCDDASITLARAAYQSLDMLVATLGRARSLSAYPWNFLDCCLTFGIR